MDWLIRAAAIAALLHITPVVVLVKRPDAVQALLPGADAYVAREVHLSAADAHRLHEAVDWSPEDGVLVFYGGTAGSSRRGTRRRGLPGSRAGPAIWRPTWPERWTKESAGHLRPTQPSTIM